MRKYKSVEEILKICNIKYIDNSALEELHNRIIILCGSKFGNVDDTNMPQGILDLFSDHIVRFIEDERDASSCYMTTDEFTNELSSIMPDYKIYFDIKYDKKLKIDLEINKENMNYFPELIRPFMANKLLYKSNSNNSYRFLDFVNEHKFVVNGAKESKHYADIKQQFIEYLNDIFYLIKIPNDDILDRIEQLSSNLVRESILDCTNINLNKVKSILDVSETYTLSVEYNKEYISK